MPRIIESTQGCKGVSMNISSVTSNYLTQDINSIERIYAPKEEESSLNKSHEAILTTLSPNLKANVMAKKINYIEEAVDTLKTIKDQIKNNLQVAMSIHQPLDSARGLLLSLES